jgi:phage-related protein
MARITAGHWPLGHFTPSQYSAGHFGGESGAPPPPPPGATVAGLTLNGTELGVLGVAIEGIDGIFGPPDVELVEQQTPGFAGTIVLERRVRGRPIVIQYSQQAPDAATLDSHTDDLAGLLLQQEPCDLIFARYPNRKLVAEYVRGPLFLVGQKTAVNTRAGSLEFSNTGAYWEDLATTSVTGITTPAAALIVGTGEIRPRLRIKGPAAGNVHVKLYDHASVLVGELKLTGPLSSSEYYVIDCKRRTIYRNTTGTFTLPPNGTNASGDLMSPTDFLLIRPLHARRLTPAWPTTEVTGLSGAGAMDVFFERTWSTAG